MDIFYIDNTNNLYFEEAWQLYLDSFPLKERRVLKEQKDILNDRNYNMTCYRKNDTLIAIAFYWEIDNYTFLEHFAINNNLRGESYGSKILKKFIDDNESIILEIEPVIDEITQRRLNFYKRLNFVLNEYEHYQIPFRKAEVEVDLKLLLMSYEKKLNKNEYEKIYKNMKKVLTKSYF